VGELVPFIFFLKNFEVLLYEIMSWVIFYPRTLWRCGRHPLQMMDRGECDLKLPVPEQFMDIVSPPIFLLLTVIAASLFEVAVVGHSPLIDNGIGLAGLISDNTSLILFRLIAFATLPILAGALGLAILRRPLDRLTLQPLFYAQCFATTPVVLLCCIAETLTRLPSPEANIPAGILFAIAAVFYVGVEASWFAREAKSGRLRGILWALLVFAMTVIVLAGTIVLFTGA
jgi:hypothetical protein